LSTYSFESEVVAINDCVNLCCVFVCVADGRRSASCPLLAADRWHISGLVRCWHCFICLLHWLSVADGEMHGSAAGISNSSAVCQQATQFLGTASTWKFVPLFISYSLMLITFHVWLTYTHSSIHSFILFKLDSNMARRNKNMQ